MNTYTFQTESPWVMIVRRGPNKSRFGTYGSTDSVVDPVPVSIKTMGDFSDSEYVYKWFNDSRFGHSGHRGYRDGSNGWTLLQTNHTIEVFYNGEKRCDVTEPVPTVSPYEDVEWVVEFVDLFTDGCNSDWEFDCREFDHIDDARQFVRELETNPVTQQHCGDIKLYGRHPNGGTCPPIDDTRPMGVCPFWVDEEDPTIIRPSVYGDPWSH